MKNIAIVTACTPDGGIGKDGDIPWSIPEDLKLFKDITKGSICVMGRVTFESLKMPEGLPGRMNIVISRKASEQTDTDRVKFVHSFEDAIEEAQWLVGWGDTIFVIGGEKIYEKAIHVADKGFITLLLEDIECDTFFPIEKMMDRNRFSLTESRRMAWQNDIPCELMIFEKV